jgi:hypothetical protein
MITRTILAITFTALLSCLAIGCGSHPVTIPYVDLHYKPPGHGYQAVIEASINGVSGRFVIDTGATAPTLTSTAVHRCAIVVEPSQGRIVGPGGGVMTMMQATNITVRFAQGFAIYWPRVLVFFGDLGEPSGTNDSFFGVIDYGSLRAHCAVMDMKKKTITLTK